MNIITNSLAHPTVQITGCIIGDRILKRWNAFLEKNRKVFGTWAIIPRTMVHGNMGYITAWLSKAEKSNGGLSGIKNGILLKLSSRFIRGLYHSQTD